MGLIAFLVYWAWTGHCPSLGLNIAFLLGALSVALNNAIKNNEEGDK